MAIPSRGIGWSTEDNLLWQISKQLERLTQVTGNSVSGSQTLAQTLVIGNNTGGTDILLNNDDAIQLENNSSIKKGTYDFGQNGGVSRICGVDYEDMWQGGIRHVFDNNGYIRNSTNGFNTVPNTSFDDTLRFKVGSFWTLDDGTTYKCIDNSTGAAVWELYSSPPKYKVYTALLTQSGSSNPQDINSGNLTVGVTYFINNNVLGDFTNVGAPNNDNGTYFVATGTTPADWGINISGDTLTFDTATPIVRILENTIGDVWFVYLDLGNYACYCSTPLFTVNKTTLNSEIFYSNTNDQMCSLISSTGDFDSQSVVFSSVRSSGSIQFENNALQDTFFEIRVYN
jgi:hypothetical protein